MKALRCEGRNESNVKQMTGELTGEVTAAFGITLHHFALSSYESYHFLLHLAMSCHVLICFACSSSSGLFSLLHLSQWAFDFILDEPGIAQNLGGCGDRGATVQLS